MNKQILDIAEMLQCEAHDYAKELVSDKVSYQDAINSWMYLKLAELFHQLNSPTPIEIDEDLDGISNFHENRW